MVWSPVSGLSGNPGEVIDQGGGGAIVNIGSIEGLGSNPRHPAYCASKAGAAMLTRCLHHETADRGIRAMGLSPGTVATQMQREIKASGINPVSKLDPNAHIPPEWVARAIAWLTGPEADAHRGTDFSLKTDQGRASVGLEPV